MAKLCDWLDRPFTRPDGSAGRVETRWAILGADAATALASHATKLLRRGSPAVVVSDASTRPLAAPVQEALGAAGIGAVEHHVPEGPEGLPPAADEDRARRLLDDARAAGAGLLIAVGSGTINDLCKAAGAWGELPTMVYGTAASMNGYTSSIAALYVGGLKATVPTRAPVGVYADPEVVARAPSELTLAGLGDLVSKPFAGCDAAVASLIAGREPWRLPGELVDETFDAVLGVAPGIGRREPAAITKLMESLWISGISMTVAGSSAPASGGEHLWSHRLDMARHDRGQGPLALHGTQVGVACGLVRPLYEGCAALTAEAVGPLLLEASPRPTPGTPRFERWITERHGDLGASRPAVIEEAAKKYQAEAVEALKRGLVEAWTEVQRELVRAASYAARVQVALTEAGAPRTPADLGLDPAEGARILRVARDIRDRTTILDLAAALLWR